MSDAKGSGPDREAATSTAACPRCGICGAWLEGRGFLETCRHCGTSFHGKCWIYYGGCAVDGCVERPVDSPVTTKAGLQVPAPGRDAIESGDAQTGCLCCAQPLAGCQVIPCVACQTPYHLICWLENAGCTWPSCPAYAPRSCDDRWPLSTLTLQRERFVLWKRLRTVQLLMVSIEAKNDLMVLQILLGEPIALGLRALLALSKSIAMALFRSPDLLIGSILIITVPVLILEVFVTPADRQRFIPWSWFRFFALGYLALAGVLSCLVAPLIGGPVVCMMTGMTYAAGMVVGAALPAARMKATWSLMMAILGASSLATGVWAALIGGRVWCAVIGLVPTMIFLTGLTSTARACAHDALSMADGHRHD